MQQGTPRAEKAGEALQDRGEFGINATCEKLPSFFFLRGSLQHVLPQFEVTAE